MLGKDTRPPAALSNCFSLSTEGCSLPAKDTSRTGTRGATSGKTFGSVNAMAMLSPALISANGLALAYGAAPLLEDVTLSVSAGEKIGLVGRNGCGKTSLLKILAGESAPDAGEISKRRGLRVGYLPQEFELDDDRMVQQNIEAGATDLLDWIARYEAGTGSDDDLAELLHQIEGADGWNLSSRINASTHALG